MADAKKPRSPRAPTVGKSEFLDVMSEILSDRGVVFKRQGLKGDVKYLHSKEEMWKLIKTVIASMTAIPAISGRSLSLSGVGTYQFNWAGSADKGRRLLRYKARISSGIQNMYLDNQDLIAKEPVSGEKLVTKVKELVKAMVDSPEDEKEDATVKVADKPATKASSKPVESKSKPVGATMV